MRKYRLGLITACLAVTAAGIPVIASAAGSPLQQYQQQQLSWGDCKYPAIPQVKLAKCAQVTVPRDWANPGAGVNMLVTISRVAATGPADKHLGAIMTNPGGPGSQGSSYGAIIATLAPEVNLRYDVIGMDPRGTGEEGGQPGFQCAISKDQFPPQDVQESLDARDRSAKSIAAHQQIAKAFADACQRDPLAPYLTTWQTTHDMDLIRGLLGEKKLNYLGYSYGTWLGAKYASMFPQNTGKVVLDSNVDWQGRFMTVFEDWPRISQRQFEQVYLPWLARGLPTQLGSRPASIKQNWEKIRAYYTSKHASGDSFDQLFVGAGSPSEWLTSALVLLQGQAGLHGGSMARELAAVPPALLTALDTQSLVTFGVPAAKVSLPLILATLPGFSTPPAADIKVGGTRSAVACGDQPTKSASWYKARSDIEGPRYPLDGWRYGLSEVCGYWHEAPQHQLPDLPRSVAGNVLVVQGELDPQTAYERARAAVRAAPGVTMVSVADATFHGQYAVAKNPCVDGMVNVFLLNNSRPGNVTCPGIPLPGEDQVFHVPGPAGAPGPAPSARSKIDDRMDGLRVRARELVGRADEGN